MLLMVISVQAFLLNSSLLVADKRILWRVQIWSFFPSLPGRSCSRPDPTQPRTIKQIEKWQAQKNDPHFAGKYRREKINSVADEIVALARAGVGNDRLISLPVWGSSRNWWLVGFSGYNGPSFAFWQHPQCRRASWINQSHEIHLFLANWRLDWGLLMEQF